MYDSYEFSAKSCGCFLRQQQKPFREDDELDETDFYDKNDDFVVAAVILAGAALRVGFLVVLLL